MKIEYVGVFDEVIVPRHDLVAKRNEVIEVADDVAAALLEQPDNWQPATAPKAGKAAPDTTAEV